MMRFHDSYLAPRYRRLRSHEAACGVSLARARALARVRVCAVAHTSFSRSSYETFDDPIPRAAPLRLEFRRDGCGRITAV